MLLCRTCRTYSTGGKFCIASLKQTLCSESKGNGQPEKPLNAIRTLFLCTSYVHETIIVVQLVWGQKFEHCMHVT